MLPYLFKKNKKHTKQHTHTGKSPRKVLERCFGLKRVIEVQKYRQCVSFELGSHHFQISSLNF